MGLVRHKRMAAAIALMAIAHAGYARSDAPKENDRSKLLGAREGTELARMALQYRPDDGVKPDCSHLVNQIYREAGLNFRFASSSEIYAGIDPFQRVRHPQPGDLIVWRGRHFIKDEGDPNYQSLRRNGARYGGTRDYSELGLAKRVELAPGAVIEVSGRFHRTERYYEYSYRVVSIVAVGWRLR